MNTLIVGLGNPILGDDGVGWKVVETVEKLLPPAFQSLPFIGYFSLGGISLMEQLVGYDRAIIVDAFASDQPAGTVFTLKLEELPDQASLHATSAHDTSLQKAMEMGRTMGAHLPDDVTIIGISVKEIHDFCEALTPPVAAIVPEAAQTVIRLLAKGGTNDIPRTVAALPVLRFP